MEITNLLIVSIITYVLGAFTKIFFTKLPNKYIPLQNVLVGLISGFLSFFGGIETNLVQAIIACLIASMGAGGIADVSGMMNKDEKIQ